MCFGVGSDGVLSLQTSSCTEDRSCLCLLVFGDQVTCRQHHMEQNAHEFMCVACYRYVCYRKATMTSYRQDRSVSDAHWPPCVTVCYSQPHKTVLACFSDHASNIFVYTDVAAPPIDCVRTRRGNLPPSNVTWFAPASPLICMTASAA